MARPSVPPFLILLALLVPVATAAVTTTAAVHMPRMRPRSRAAAIRAMLRYLSKTIKPTSDRDEWSWTVRPRNAGDLRKPMPTNKGELNHMCWSYFGHPQTIRDVNSFFKWGCQPYPITCNGVKALPKQCLGSMFFVNPRVRPAHVKALYLRCNLKTRPIDRRTRRYVSYCEDLISAVQSKIQRLTASRRHVRRGRARN